MSPFGAGPEAMIDMLGVPPVAPNQFFVDAVIREGGDMDVVLDGIDGDAVLGGNWNYLSDLAVRGRWIELKRELRGITAAHHVPIKALARHYVAPPLRHGHLGRAFADTEMAALSPDVAPAVLETIDESWARAGVRVSHPFMDRRLVEFCLGLPRNQKIRKGITKFVLRTAMRDLLPSEVTERAEKAELGSAFFAATFGPGKRDVDRGLRVAAAKGITGTYGDAERLQRSFAAGNDGLEAFREAFIALWRVRAGAPGSPMQNWKGAFAVAVLREAAR